MKKIVFLCVSMFLCVACARTDLQTVDSFTGATITRSETLEANPANGFEYLKFRVICTTPKNGPAEYAIIAAVGGTHGDPLLEYSPQIKEKESLQLLVEGKILSFSTTDIGKSVEAGFLKGWNVETATYKGVTKEELAKIASAKEVKARVMCSHIPYEHGCTFTQKMKDEIAKFLERKAPN